jgi:hypothetical protein
METASAPAPTLAARAPLEGGKEKNKRANQSSPLLPDQRRRQTQLGNCRPPTAHGLPPAAPKRSAEDSSLLPAPCGSSSKRVSWTNRGAFLQPA